jgi:hypothetical protein
MKRSILGTEAALGNTVDAYLFAMTKADIKTSSTPPSRPTTPLPPVDFLYRSMYSKARRKTCALSLDVDITFETRSETPNVGANLEGNGAEGGVRGEGNADFGLSELEGRGRMVRDEEEEYEE